MVAYFVTVFFKNNRVFLEDGGGALVTLSGMYDLLSKESEKLNLSYARLAIY